MNDQNKTRLLDADPNRRNWQPSRWPKTLMFAFLFAATVLAVRSVSAQTVPVLTITSLGTNQFSVAITNSIGTATYDLLWTPELANPDYPWTWAAPGTPGQTNFLLNMQGYPEGYFETVLDTNAVPLWEAATPANPSSGILQVYIYGPSNGAVLQ